MRAFPVLFALSTLPLMAGSSVAVLVQYEQARYSASAREAMQSEAASILKDVGVTVEWASVPRNDAGDLLVFKMRGKCSMDAFPPLPDELGLPLATSFVTDGRILSFGTVHCDRVRHVVKQAAPPNDAIYGRALGRVLAHELMHMVTGSKHHDDEGVFKAGLSGRDLVKADIRAQVGLVQKSSGPAPKYDAAQLP